MLFHHFIYLMHLNCLHPIASSFECVLHTFFFMHRIMLLIIIILIQLNNYTNYIRFLFHFSVCVFPFIFISLNLNILLFNINIVCSSSISCSFLRRFISMLSFLSLLFFLFIIDQNQVCLKLFVCPLNLIVYLIKLKLRSHELFSFIFLLCFPFSIHDRNHDLSL